MEPTKNSPPMSTATPVLAVSVVRAQRRLAMFEVVKNRLTEAMHTIEAAAQDRSAYPQLGDKRLSLIRTATESFLNRWKKYVADGSAAEFLRTGTENQLYKGVLPVKVVNASRLKPVVPKRHRNRTTFQIPSKQDPPFANLLGAIQGRSRRGAAQRAQNFYHKNPRAIAKIVHTFREISDGKVKEDKRKVGKSIRSHCRIVSHNFATYVSQETFNNSGLAWKHLLTKAERREFIRGFVTFGDTVITLNPIGVRWIRKNQGLLSEYAVLLNRFGIWTRLSDKGVLGIYTRQAMIAFKDLDVLDSPEDQARLEQVISACRPGITDMTESYKAYLSTKEKFPNLRKTTKIYAKLIEEHPDLSSVLSLSLIYEWQRGNLGRLFKNREAVRKFESEIITAPKRELIRAAIDSRMQSASDTEKKELREELRWIASIEANCAKQGILLAATVQAPSRIEPIEQRIMPPGEPKEAEIHLQIDSKGGANPITAQEKSKNAEGDEIPSAEEEKENTPGPRKNFSTIDRLNVNHKLRKTYPLIISRAILDLCSMLQTGSQFSETLSYENRQSLAEQGRELIGDKSPTLADMLGWIANFGPALPYLTRQYLLEAVYFELPEVVEDLCESPKTGSAFRCLVESSTIKTGDSKDVFKICDSDSLSLILPGLSQDELEEIAMLIRRAKSRFAQHWGPPRQSDLLDWVGSGFSYQGTLLVEARPAIKAGLNPCRIVTHVRNEILKRRRPKASLGNDADSNDAAIF